jgi:hypothetical protein
MAIKVASRTKSTKAVRIIFQHLGGVTYSDRNKDSKKLKWYYRGNKLPTSARAEIEALGIKIHESESRWAASAMYIHVPADFDVRAATKGLKSPNLNVKKTRPVPTVRFMVSPITILQKLAPYVMGEDDMLSPIELAQRIHDRVKEDVA